MKNPALVIAKKRDGKELSPDEIQFIIDGVTSGDLADYHIGALLMAIVWRGMTPPEMAEWTQAMLHSGIVLEHQAPGKTVDKHSTGGVGDKISIPLAPAVAACGGYVPMISGRGLGHTGGTLDKLESIPGFNVNLSTAEFQTMVRDLGVSMIGQTKEIAPADKRLYSLRDVTATVESVPLISSSIMSKKLAEGIDALVLDCKVGSGAFMKKLEDARTLATAIRGIAHAAGKACTVMITQMDDPIGCMIGNSLEIKESIDVLSNRGPADTTELTIKLGGEMLFLSDRVASPEAGCEAIAASLADGSAKEKFRQLVAAHGGDENVVDDPDAVLPISDKRHAVRADASGWVAGFDSMALGLACMDLGAGRREASDSVNPSVGVELAVQRGDQVKAGDVLATLYHDKPVDDSLEARISGAIHISDSAVQQTASRILEVMR